MNVLVTGSAGFIGQAVKRVLDVRGDTLVPFDLPDNDILDRNAVTAAVEGVDAVINLAGRLGTAEIFGSEYAAAKVNVLGAVNVYDAALTIGVPVVQIGTGHKGQPNPYAITKACAEDIALARAQWAGHRLTVVRAYHAYGPGQKVSAPHGTGKVRKIIPSFICRALTGMDIEVFGDGNNLIDLVHVDQVAYALVEAINGPYGEVVEAGTGKATTVTQAALDVAGACSSPSTIAFLPARRGEPEGAEVVAGGPVCPYPWPFGLMDTIAYYRDWLARQ